MAFECDFNFNTIIQAQATKKEPRTASRKQRVHILREQKFKCFVCGQVNANLEVDHVIPHAVGGVTELKNLRALCPNCHADKSRNSNEADKIRYAKKLKLIKSELCWTCEKIVSPYFFATGECLDCSMPHPMPPPSPPQPVWNIPFSPITSDDEQVT